MISKLYLEDKIKKLELENKNIKKENEELKEKQQLKSNAGRKKIKFKDSDIELIKIYRMHGYSIRELANMFNCSVGLMHKIIKDNKE